MKSFDWDLQAKFEHISDSELQGDGYLESILAVLDVLAGEREGDDSRRAAREALYDVARRKEEIQSLQEALQILNGEQVA